MMRITVRGRPVLEDYIWHHGHWKSLWRRGLPNTGAIWLAIGIVTFNQTGDSQTSQSPSTTSG
jgi:hypothetical protein